MALRLSTGLRCSLLGNAHKAGITMDYVDGGVGNDYITDSENEFLLRGFKIGDLFTTTNSTTGANNLADEPILAIAAGKVEFLSGQVNTAEVFEADTTILGDNGGSLQTLFLDSVIRVFSGSQPATADAAETGTILLEITLSSLPFVAGVAGNGLELYSPSSGVIGITSVDVWSGVGLANGTAGWFRLYDNLLHTGALTSSVRLDGNCGTSNAQLNMSSTTVTLGATTTVDSFEVTMPAS